MRHYYPQGPGPRAVLLVMTLMLGSIGAAPAQKASDSDSDLADSVRRRNEVAAQETEADVRGALLDAQRLVATSVPKAIDRLQKALDQLESDITLPAKHRESLRHMLADRIRVTRTSGAPSEESVDKHIEKSKRRASEELRLADQVRLKRLLDAIARLQREGKTDEAEKEARDLAGREPNNPAAQAASRTTSVANQLAANRQLQGQKERGFGDTVRDVDRSSVPARDDVSFPKDWKQRTKNRSHVDAVPLTAREKAIFKALGSQISVRFKDSRLEDVIEYLQTTTGLIILVDRAAMDEQGVNYDSPVTVNLKGVSVRFLLRKIFGDLGLTYVIKDESIQAVTPKRARELMVTRTYYIADLVTNGLEVVMLIDLIQSSIEPESWKVHGGDGTIFYHPLTRSLVIKQSAEFHGMFSGGSR